MKRLALVCVLSGMMWGQTSNHYACDSVIWFHGKQKAIKEIFPEECNDSTAAEPPCDIYHLPPGKTWCRLQPEPPDVPAIKKRQSIQMTIPPSGDMPAYGQGQKAACEGSPWGGAWNMDAHQCTVVAYTCTDKSRILLTAENGKKWCHKVQP